MTSPVGENFNDNGHILKYMTAVVIAYNPLWTDKEGNDRNCSRCTCSNHSDLIYEQID